MEFEGLGEVIEIRRRPQVDAADPRALAAEVTIDLHDCGRIQFHCTLKHSAAFCLGQGVKLTLTPQLNGVAAGGPTTLPLPGFEQLDAPAPAPEKARRAKRGPIAVSDST